MSDILDSLERIERLVMISSKGAFNVREAAMFLGLSESRVRHLVHDRLIPHYKRGANVFFRKSELEDWMLQDRIPTIDEIEQEAYRYTLSAR